MNIQEIKPSECFTGLDSNGWLVYPNRFHCPTCDYGVYFNEQSLSNGFCTRPERPLKLDSNITLFFQNDIERFLLNKSERFILDFRCPQCKLPYVIGFEGMEVQMALWRYRPIVVLSSI